ncbi:hypothetical protein CC79DRAFT_817590 [Sarocladium strictum]
MTSTMQAVLQLQCHQHRAKWRRSHSTPCKSPSPPPKPTIPSPSPMSRLLSPTASFKKSSPIFTCTVGTFIV